VSGANACHTNDYKYILIDCQNCNTLVATHLASNVCQQHFFPPPIAQINLSYYNLPADYLCVIIDGPDPVNDAFIEWFYHVPITSAATSSFITGKFTFSASAAYIKHWYDAMGGNYNGQLGNGIPMFVQPSHNQF
jgi:hypothetical protein